MTMPPAASDQPDDHRTALPQPYDQQPFAPATYPGPVVPSGSGRAATRQFAFDGGAGTFVGTALLGLLITICTLGLCYPFALVLRERWRAKHSYIDGRQLVFNGSAWGLFGLWWKWLLLMVITLGIYSFWVGPRLYRWRWEHTAWAQQLPAVYGAARN